MITDSLPEYTADQLTEGIANALHAKNFQAVHDFLLALAFKDPHRAQLVLDTINVGLAIGSERRAATDPEESAMTNDTEAQPRLHNEIRERLVPSLTPPTISVTAMLSSSAQA